jgi:hypothetical protein
LPKAGKRVMSPQTAREMRTILEMAAGPAAPL